MARRSRRHPVHRYQRFRLKQSGKVVYRCMIPGCTHYLFEEFALGQKSICNRCDKEFVMTRAAMDLKKPHCLECTRGYKKKDEPSKPQTADVLQNLDNLLKGL
jgi:hypothetical protein